MTFNFRPVGRQLEVTGAVPKSFLPRDAKDRFSDGSQGLKGHLPGEASFFEVIASRYYYILGCCDYNEGCMVFSVRVVGWGCRIAFYASSVLFCILSAARGERNAIGQYGFSRERNDGGVLANDQSDIFEWFVYATFIVWCVSIATEMFSYLVGRGSKRPHDEQISVFPFVMFNRVSLGDDDQRCCIALAMLVWFLGLAAAAIVAVHTIVAHAFVTRNMYIIWLLVLFAGFELLAALADAVSIGTIDGLAVQNRNASWMASVRVVAILPIQIIFSAFFCWLCRPPWTVS